MGKKDKYRGGNDLEPKVTEEATEVTEDYTPEDVHDNIARTGIVNGDHVRQIKENAKG